MRALFIILFFFCQLVTAAPPAAGGAGPDLTISYSISLRTRRDNAGIAETYNGGMQTLFAGKHATRLRLASLMRIESVFARFDDGQLQHITLVKESGAVKHKTQFTADQWEQYNVKYKGAVCHLSDDTTLVLKRVCKKAIITLKDGRLMTAWYYPAAIKPSFYYLQPAFAAIPGIVLKYEYTYRKKTIVYTATAISNAPISADVFAPPAE